MAVTRPRTRLVFFRVSEDEYRQFLDLCESQGARSLSDLARTAVFRMVDEGATPNRRAIAADLQQIDRDIRTLKQRVGELVRVAGGALPEGFVDGAGAQAGPAEQERRTSCDGEGHAF